MYCIRPELTLIRSYIKLVDVNRWLVDVRLDVHTMLMGFH